MAEMELSFDETGGTSFIGDRGADFVQGEFYGGDFRFALLLRLVDKGAIDLSDAEDILRYTQPTDDPKRIIGFVAGAKGVSAIAIQQALQGTEWQVDKSEVEEISVPFSEMLKEAGGVFEDASERFVDFLQWPVRALATGGQAALSPLFGEEGYYSEGSEADREHRSRTRDAARNEIDLLQSLGYLSTSEAKDLRNRTGKYGTTDYQFLLDELQEIHNRLSDEDKQAEFRDGSPAMKLLGERRGLEITGSVDTQPALLNAEAGDVVDGVAVVDSDQLESPYGTDGSFQGLLAAEGVTGPEDVLVRRVRAAYIDADAVYDKATGQTYSVSEWEFIKTDAAAQARYVTNKRVAPAVQALLDKSFFSDQVSNVQPLPANYDQLSAEEQRMLKQEQRIAFRTGAQKTGQPQIPIEDLAIPSLVPTDPWEVSTFDFLAGDGRSQWMSFTPRQRDMRTKLMLDQGLINEAQYEAMGGAGGLNLAAMNIWEMAIGLTAQTQWDPIASLNALGIEKRVFEAAQTRTGSGASAPKYSVPSSLRTVPDYKTLAQESKAIFSNELGRDLEDWELGILADELKDKYVQSNRQRIVAHKDAWDDAVAGGTMDVDFTEVEDPASGLQYDIEERYANELDRKERVEDRANDRRVLMDSISLGRQMI
jgi:hypothetical protein